MGFRVGDIVRYDPRLRRRQRDLQEVPDPLVLGIVFRMATPGGGLDNIGVRWLYYKNYWTEHHYHNVPSNQLSMYCPKAAAT